MFGSLSLKLQGLENYFLQKTRFSPCKSLSGLNKNFGPEFQWPEAWWFTLTAATCCYCKSGGSQFLFMLSIGWQVESQEENLAFCLQSISVTEGMNVAKPSDYL